MVIGPTPPGTGVMKAARSRARSKSTSPTSLPAALRLVPTSITTAPGLIQSPRMSCALPMAATSTSALADLGGEVAGARVADGHGGVALEQQERHRLADQVAAPDHDGAGALELDAGGVEQAHDAERRARAQAGVPRDQAGLVQRVQAVDVLGRIDGVEDRRGIDVRRQRQLDENAVGIAARVELLHQLEQLVLRGGRRQLVRDRRDAALGAGLALVAHVGRRGGVVADQHGRQPGRAPERVRETPPPRPRTSSRTAAATALPSMICAAIRRV